MGVDLARAGGDSGVKGVGRKWGGRSRGVRGVVGNWGWEQGVGRRDLERGVGGWVG